MAGLLISFYAFVVHATLAGIKVDGLLSAELAAGIRRVKGVRRIGVRVGNWLTAEQGEVLTWVMPETLTLPLHVHAFSPLPYRENDFSISN